MLLQGDKMERKSRYSRKSSPVTREYGQRANPGIRKDKPDYNPSGKLADSLLTKAGKRLKYVEPQEAAIPQTKWRLHVFKGDDQIRT